MEKSLFPVKSSVCLQLIEQACQSNWRNLLASTQIVILAYLTEIEYYGVYEANIADATLTFIIFKPLEHLLESMIGSLAINQKKILRD
jgi:hypothetical protein